MCGRYVYIFALPSNSVIAKFALLELDLFLEVTKFETFIYLKP